MRELFARERLFCSVNRNSIRSSLEMNVGSVTYREKYSSSNVRTSNLHRERTRSTEYLFTFSLVNTNLSDRVSVRGQNFCPQDGETRDRVSVHWQNVCPADRNSVHETATRPTECRFTGKNLPCSERERFAELTSAENLSQCRPESSEADTQAGKLFA